MLLNLKLKKINKLRKKLLRNLKNTYQNILNALITRSTYTTQNDCISVFDITQDGVYDMYLFDGSKLVKVCNCVIEKKLESQTCYLMVDGKTYIIDANDLQTCLDDLDILIVCALSGR